MSWAFVYICLGDFLQKERYASCKSLGGTLHAVEVCHQLNIPFPKHWKGVLPRKSAVAPQWKWPTSKDEKMTQVWGIIYTCHCDKFISNPHEVIRACDSACSFERFRCWGEVEVKSAGISAWRVGFRVRLGLLLFLGFTTALLRTVVVYKLDNWWCYDVRMCGRRMICDICSCMSVVLSCDGSTSLSSPGKMVGTKEEPYCHIPILPSRWEPKEERLTLLRAVGSEHDSVGIEPLPHRNRGLGLKDSRDCEGDIVRLLTFQTQNQCWGFMLQLYYFIRGFVDKPFRSNIWKEATGDTQGLEVPEIDAGYL